MQVEEDTVVKLPSGVIQGAVVAVVLGVVGTAAGLLRGGTDAWTMLLVHFLYWTGIAQGMVVWSAILRATQATWAPGVSRLGRAAVWFLPWSVAVFLLLWFGGREHWLPWLREPPHGKEAWLNPTFFFWRELGILAVMAGLSAWLVHEYRRAEGDGLPATEAAHARLNRTAIALVIAYAFLYTVLAFDLVMSLDPHWFSSLLGAYFFVGNLYLSMGALIIAGALFGVPLGLADLLGPRQFRDMGNLMLGFGLLTTGFFFAQYLTIWYGNLPEETSFLIRRAYAQPWANVGYVVLFAAYLGPFLLLCFPQIKASARRLVPVAALVCFGMAVERWMLVAPTLAPNQNINILFDNILKHVTFQALAFGGLLVLVMTRSLQRRPKASPLDTSLELSEGVAL